VAFGMNDCLKAIGYALKLTDFKVLIPVTFAFWRLMADDFQKWQSWRKIHHSNVKARASAARPIYFDDQKSKVARKSHILNKEIELK